MLMDLDDVLVEHDDTLFDVDPAMLRRSNRHCPTSPPSAPTSSGTGRRADHGSSATNSRRSSVRPASPGVVKAPTDRSFILANVGENHPGVFDGLITTLAWTWARSRPDLRRRGSAFVAGAPCSGYATRWDSSTIRRNSRPSHKCDDSAGVQFIPASRTRFTVLARRRARIDHASVAASVEDRSRARSLRRSRIRCAR